MGRPVNYSAFVFHLHMINFFFLFHLTFRLCNHSHSAKHSLLKALSFTNCLELPINDTYHVARKRNRERKRKTKKYFPLFCVFGTVILIIKTRFQHYIICSFLHPYVSWVLCKLYYFTDKIITHIMHDIRSFSLCFITICIKIMITISSMCDTNAYLDNFISLCFFIWGVTRTYYCMHLWIVLKSNGSNSAIYTTTLI